MWFGFSSFLRFRLHFFSIISQPNQAEFPRPVWIPMKLYFAVDSRFLLLHQVDQFSEYVYFSLCAERSNRNKNNEKKSISTRTMDYIRNNRFDVTKSTTNKMQPPFS